MHEKYACKYVETHLEKAVSRKCHEVIINSELHSTPDVFLNGF